MTFKVEKNIPIPSSKRDGRKEKYPLSILQLGDSFFIPDTTQIKVAPNLHTRARKLNIKLSIRTVANGLRVWRVA